MTAAVDTTAMTPEHVVHLPSSCECLSCEYDRERHTVLFKQQRPVAFIGEVLGVVLRSKKEEFLCLNATVRSLLYDDVDPSFHQAYSCDV